MDWRIVVAVGVGRMRTFTSFSHEATARIGDARGENLRSAYQPHSEGLELAAGPSRTSRAFQRSRGRPHPVVTKNAFGQRPVIASVSFGAARLFVRRHKRKKVPPVTVELTHGSLLVMGGPCRRSGSTPSRRTRAPPIRASTSPSAASLGLLRRNHFAFGASLSRVLSHGPAACYFFGPKDG
jgi:2OG-Fe(II) oxygenase superfamily